MTLPRRFAWAILTTALTVAAFPVRTDEQRPRAWAASIQTNHSELHDSLERLYSRSKLWRTAVGELETLGRRVVVVTPKHVRVQDPRDGRIRAFDEDVIAEVQPLAEQGTRVDAVVVVVNVELLESRRTIWTTRIDFENDLDRIIAHEVYGHAIPYLLAGDLSGRCADPVKGQRIGDACAIQRENAIRGEAGLGTRIDNGLSSLSLARRFRH
jgi:hypothetical protein